MNTPANSQNLDTGHYQFDSAGALLGTNLPLPKRSGKVRDVYDLGERLMIVSTDRISAFDFHSAIGDSRQRPTVDFDEPILVQPCWTCDTICFPPKSPTTCPLRLTRLSAEGPSHDYRKSISGSV